MRNNMEQDDRFFVHTMRRSRRVANKLALQTAIIHLFCSVSCIVIGIFSVAIFKSHAMAKVYGLPLWMGLLLLLTGFSGIQCHVKRTKCYAGLYSLLSLISMLCDLIGIAWMLSAMEQSNVIVICLVCISTFDMGIACLSTAMACNILFEDCKLFKHERRGQSSGDTTSAPCNIQRFQDGETEINQERVQLTSQLSTEVQYTQPRREYGPPPYTDAIGPPPPYVDS